MCSSAIWKRIFGLCSSLRFLSFLVISSITYLLFFFKVVFFYHLGACFDYCLFRNFFSEGFGLAFWVHVDIVQMDLSNMLQNHIWISLSCYRTAKGNNRIALLRGFFFNETNLI